MDFLLDHICDADRPNFWGGLRFNSGASQGD